VVKRRHITASPKPLARYYLDAPVLRSRRFLAATVVIGTVPTAAVAQLEETAERRAPAPVIIGSSRALPLCYLGLPTFQTAGGGFAINHASADGRRDGKRPGFATISGACRVEGLSLLVHILGLMLRLLLFNAFGLFK
jgi:hypothetical protein